MHELDLSLVDQAAAIRRGDVGPLSLVDGALDRIARDDVELNAVPILFDSARTPCGAGAGAPLRGVPFLLKDSLCAVAGERRTEGTRWLQRLDHRDRADSMVVQRLRAAGLSLIGRTNVPEFASADTAEPLAHGPTRNPWDPARSTGGSSGGSAAAVAAGFVAAAHGTDASGSVRLPASWCGVVGFKPTLGLVTTAPDMDVSWGIEGFRYCHGVLTRRVADVALLMEVMAGAYDQPAHLGAGASSPADVRRSLERPPVGLRIGLMDCGDDVDVLVARAVQHLGALLEEMGHVVVPGFRFDTERVPPPLDVERYPGSAMSGLIDWWRRATGTEPEGDDLEPLTWMFDEIGRATTARQLLTTLDWMQLTAVELGSWTNHVDVMVTPCTPSSAPLLGRYAGAGDLDVLMTELAVTARYTNLFSLTGQPAISLPLATSSTGLPCGIQLAARRGADALLLRLAYQIERAAPWHARAPRPTTWPAADNESRTTR